jgi:hypothetical protein
MFLPSIPGFERKISMLSKSINCCLRPFAIWSADTKKKSTDVMELKDEGIS